MPVINANDWLDTPHIASDCLIVGLRWGDCKSVPVAKISLALTVIRVF
jgi:hypothetical protein